MTRGLVAILLLLGGSGGLLGQEAAQDALTAKQKAARWVDRFAADQVLFHPKDVEKLREKVGAMSDDEVQKWWDETTVRRELLDSVEWAKTRLWLKEFLKVQAVYSDEQIKYFQSENFDKARESPRSLKDVMDEINGMRRRLAEGAKISAATRQQVLASQNAYRQDAVRQREAAVLRRSPPPAGGSPVVVRPQRTRYNRPLVSSLDAARWSIVRDFYPRW